MKKGGRTKGGASWDDCQGEGCMVNRLFFAARLLKKGELSVRRSLIWLRTAWKGRTTAKGGTKRKKKKWGTNYRRP